MNEEIIVYNGLALMADLLAERIAQHLRKENPSSPTSEDLFTVEQAAEIFTKWAEESSSRKEERILRAEEVAEKVGASRSTIRRWEDQGDFPKRRKLPGAKVGWLSTEIDDWLRSRPSVKS